MRRTPILLCVSLLWLAACDDDKKKDAPVASAVTKPLASTVGSTVAAASAAPGNASDPPLATGLARFAIATGKGSFLIDAPLEKIKGSSDEVRGRLDVNVKDLAKSTGEIDVRLSTLKTATFDDKDKNVAQTEHARNWMEVGNDSAADTRMKYEWAALAITSIEATPAALADAKEDNGARTVKAKVSGDLTIHGVTSKKTVAVTVTFKGPADAPTEIDLKTDETMPVSMKEHGIMPRDKVGGLLNGALDRIGKKIDDKVQVSFEAVTKATMPAHP
jgi:polyisoprenoid-binding protein YceI